MAGVKSPSIVLTRRMCPNLFALAKWTQFQVTKKSHLWYEAKAKWRASPVGSAGMS
jgi:hypothetical protein